MCHQTSADQPQLSDLPPPGETALVLFSDFSFSFRNLEIKSFVAPTKPALMEADYFFPDVNAVLVVRKLDNF